MASRPTLEEEAEREQLPLAPPAPLIIPRGIQLVLLLVALLALWVAARAARHVVEIVVVASFIALVLNPFIEFLGRRGIRRPLAIPLAYISLLVVIGGIGLALAQPISDQINTFQHNFPHIVKEANRRLAEWQRFFNKHSIHIQLQKQGHTALDTIQSKVLKSSSSILSFTTSLLKSAADAAISLVLIFVMSVYLLIYARTIGALVRRWLPAGDGTPEDDYPTRVQRAVAGYVRGQLFFCVVMGTTAGFSLWVFGTLGIFGSGRAYAFAFGAFFGVMELVPFIGPVLGAIPPVVVALFENPLTALWVVLLFIALQQLEGHIVAPQIFGHALRINPLLVILALLFGDAIYGIIGALMALPVAAVLRETILYLRRHVVLEPWRPQPPPPT
ncbi:MAG TPA: AI-2E family transporter [Solirubrobacteraceae bacterium]|jgi:predicted PurR-regulated permease PerM|nr:AI-2E family transporter [Solirubrobacteraceae bacterium]